jgi:hypothetical protein
LAVSKVTVYIIRSLEKFLSVKNVNFVWKCYIAKYVHGFVITQLSTIQPLLAPPQNNPHIYLVYEVNTPQNNYVHPLSPVTRVTYSPIEHSNTTNSTPNTFKPQFDIQSYIEDSFNTFPIPHFHKLTINKNHTWDGQIIPLR